ncbi:MAG: Zn-ribbon domain-containing OB-fold protein, partial [Candidatus Binatia bacterium]
SGRGTIWSFVVAHPPLLPAYQELAPYNVVVVTLDDDPSLRLVGNLVASPDGAINEIDPATIRIGEPVRVVFQKVEDVYLPRWVRS